MEEFPQLSNRERDVVAHLLQGKSNKQIALDMNVTERTVEFHLKNIYSKFQVSSRVELVLRLKEDGNGLESEKLGKSTVVEEGDSAENDAGLTSSNWVTSLREAVTRTGKELEMKLSLDTTTDDARPATFFESIRVCFIKYAEFNGRASRSEFWWFALFVTLGTSAFAMVHETLGGLFLLAVLLPFLAAGSRRLRDSNYSPWWLLSLLLPVGGLVILGSLWVMPSADTVTEKSPL